VSVAHHCAQALDRARLYESTQRARADAERANRIKDEFVSIVSHELRTPLNAILGWTSMLQRGALAPEKAARALQSVYDNASRQARLIEELLDFSRVTSGRASLQMESVDVRELIRGVVESMIPTAVGRAVDLHLSSVPPVYVRGDIRRLVSKWTGEYQLTLDQVLDEMIERCRELKLRAVGHERQLRTDFTVLLTAKTVHSLYSPLRRQWIAL